MSLAWPWMLLGLLAVPPAVLWYRRLVRARAARRAELAALGLVAPAALATGRRRHVPPALLLVAMVLLVTALARPEATVPQPRREGTVILAFDVSASMAATDVAPTRMEGAKAAAREFVLRQPESVLMGVVAFGGTGLVTQEVTADRAGVLAAIDRLSPQGGTGLARGLQTALSAIVGRPVEVDTSSGGAEPRGADLGYHGSAAIVLISDGENTDDLDPVAMADIASGAGVRVYPVGLGSPAGTVLQIDGFQVATALDEPTLREIAAHTDGEYFAAPDEQSLAAVSDSVVAWTVRTDRVEVTGLVAAAAALLVLIGVGLSLTWYGRAV
ncbi:vWA domain-containing protein [Pseudonocardia humida]|uniref:VWA domain-containing protein n=1 Tax=Pseudonocardia humida TaxID=2800819 RepID=A0ABT1A9Q4_9PSEU|nr:VWA domain-containing protein [Pseudonocardia humida]MCO1659673.1 VWA domain-containing protein [Pseudonocardia humida]